VPEPVTRLPGLPLRAEPHAAGEPAGIYWPRLARRIYQGFFLALFLAALMLMTAEGIHRLPVTWLFHLDPLSALVSLLASWSLTAALVWSLAIVALTVLAGRAFCGWICPLGTVLQLASWLTRRIRRGPATEQNRWRPHFALKYLLLIALLAAAALGAGIAGLFDPLSLFSRSVGSGLAPALHQLVGTGGWRVRVFIGAWLTGLLFLAVLVANRWITRWWCRALCPLGALLGVIARASIARIRIDPARCTHCNRCAADCQGADEPFARHRVAECHVCLNCIASCPDDAIAFRPFAPEDAPRGGVSLPRRQVLGAAVAGVALIPLFRASTHSATQPGPLAIRPPGAQPEAGFLATCIRCGACVNACPTSALQPALGEAGIEGLYTPVLVARQGWCEPSCLLCGHVCPTGAIRPLTAAEKGWTTEAGQGIRIGTAFFDHGRCLPWGMNIPCIVCQEVCPTSPKAIWLEEVTALDREGKPVRLQRPRIEPGLCVGCGLCEAKCPITDVAAVRISRIGESRETGSSFRLGNGGQQPRRTDLR
jgi:MauM/NapG family ferredoxin protein